MWTHILYRLRIKNLTLWFAHGFHIKIDATGRWYYRCPSTSTREKKMRDIDTSQWWKKAGTPYFVGENHGFFLNCSPKSIVIHVKLRWVSMLAETLQSTIPHMAWLMIICWDGKSHEISMLRNKIRFTLNFAWWIQLPLELRKPNAIKYKPLILWMVDDSPFNGL